MSVAPENEPSPFVQILLELVDNMQGLGQEIIDAAKAVKEDPNDRTKVDALVSAIYDAKDEAIKNVTGAGSMLLMQMLNSQLVAKGGTKLFGNTIRGDKKPPSEAPTSCWPTADNGEEAPATGRHAKPDEPDEKPNGAEQAVNSPFDDVINNLIDTGGRKVTEFANNAGPAIANIFGNFFGNQK